MTKRALIIERILQRCQGITIAAGFATDAGLKVFVNETPDLGKDDPEVAIAIVIDDDVTEWHGDKALIELPLDICAVAKVDIDYPWRATEAAIGDIKKAIEIDTNLDGLLRDYMTRRETRNMEREQGSSAAGVIVRYVLPYSEKWGGA